MNPIKVLFFIPGFAGGGAERQCVYLINALSAREDFAVGLVHFHEGVNFELIDRRNVSLFRLRTRSNYDPRNVWRAHRVFARERPDIVFSWLHACDAFAWGSRTMGARFQWIMAERNSWYPRDPRFWLRDTVGRHADMIVANSDKGDQYWAARGVPATRRRVIGNVLADSWFAPRTRPPAAPLVCYAGRLEAQKRVSFLTDAFAELSLQRQDVRFIIVGEGSLRSEVESRLGLARPGSIELHGFRPDIRRVYEQAPVFVNVSSHEGMPNTVIENLALGNRVVLSRIPEHVALVGDRYPFLVDVNATSKELAGVIDRATRTVVGDEELRSLHDRLLPMRVGTVAARYASLFMEVAAAHAGYRT